MAAVQLVLWDVLESEFSAFSPSSSLDTYSIQCLTEEHYDGLQINASQLFSYTHSDSAVGAPKQHH